MFDFRRILTATVTLIALSTPLAAQNEPPQLAESRELTSKVIKLFGEAKYDEALPLAKRALELREAALGAAHQDLLPLLTNLGEIYRAKKKPGQARPYFDRALGIAEKSFSANDRGIARLLDRLGLTAYDARQDSDAEGFFSRSLAIKEQSPGVEPAEVATTTFNLAEVYRRRGDYQKAEPLYERVIKIREKEPGRNNAELIRAVEAYVMTLLAQKKNAQADVSQKKLNDLLAAQGIVRGGILNGTALKLVQPEYPLAARMDHASGQVRVSVVIDETGKVISAQTIYDGAIHRALAAAAEDAARRSVFTPTFLSGAAVKVSGLIIYNFIAQ